MANLAGVTVYSAPDDGHKGRSKHVEHTNITRVASCWFIIYYILPTSTSPRAEAC